MAKQSSCRLQRVFLIRNRDRSPPDGYRLSVVAFKNGQLTEPSTSTTAAVNIMVNANNGGCPKSCFRPASLAWDSKDSPHMSSDSTGEILSLVGRVKWLSSQIVYKSSVQTLYGRLTIYFWFGLE